LGHNVINYQFTFINYIITQYVTFPAIGLLNLYYIIMIPFKKRSSRNKLEYNEKLRNYEFKYYKQMAYTAHMMVCGFIFAVTAPSTNIIVFVTYLFLVIIDRYTLLKITVPDITSDFSAQSNMLIRMIDSVFTGVIFMLVCTYCYFQVIWKNAAIAGCIVCIICLIGAIIAKRLIDERYNRVHRELVRGQYDESSGLIINPAHVDSEYDTTDNF